MSDLSSAIGGGSDEKLEVTGTMNRKDRNTLTRCRQDIVQDLEVPHIIDYLIEYGIVDDEIKQKIMAEVSRCRYISLGLKIISSPRTCVPTISFDYFSDNFLR